MGLQVPSIGAAATGARAAIGGALRGLRAAGKGLAFAGKLDPRFLDLLGNEDLLLAQMASLAQNPLPAVRTTLERGLTHSLAPPGKSPPAPSKPHASTVQTKTGNAGQQSEFSGTSLDAKSAKEPPAQQQNPTPTSPAPARDDVAAALQPLLTPTDSLEPQLLPGRAPASSAAAASHTASTATANSGGKSDILSRMLGRAAVAQTHRTDSSQLSNKGPVTVTQPAAKEAQSAAFERLIAVVAEHSASPAQSQGEGDQPHALQTPPPAAAFSPQSAAAVSAQSLQPAPHAAAAVDPEALIEQLVKSLTMRTSGGTSEVRLRLAPDHLGSVALKITVTGNTIDANVVAQSGHVRDLLVSGQAQLARSLSAAGLNLGAFSVDVSGGNAGFSGRHAQHQHASAKTGSFGFAIDEEDPQTDGRFGPPLIPAGQSIVLNYLA